MSFESLLLITVHAHLYKNEIIGYLGGYSISIGDDDAPKLVFIHEGFPCEPLEGTGVDR